MCDDCVVCGKWPERDRWALREMLDTLPMDEPVCDECRYVREAEPQVDRCKDLLCVLLKAEAERGVWASVLTLQLS